MSLCHRMCKCSNALFICSILLFPNVLNAVPTKQKATNAIALTAAFFDRIKAENNTAEMRLFFTQMPKGGDIHHHYSGAVYGEEYLEWAGKLGYFINTNTLKVDAQKISPYITIDSLKRNADLYRLVLQNWSCIDFNNHFHIENSPDNHFFTTFDYFGSVSGAFINEALQKLKERAIAEHVQYIETMLVSPSYKIKYSFDAAGAMRSLQQKHDSTGLLNIIDSCVTELSKDATYRNILQSYRDSLYSYHRGIDDSLFTLRIQTYTSRNASPENVFTKLYMAFNAVAEDSGKLLVGVNIVGPENGPVALQDYWLHMQMFAYLKSIYKNVKTSMHAGELRLGLVQPEDLVSHIDQAVMTARADRIGHGIDIVHEKNAVSLLNTMRTRQIPVEINLTSNEFILGINELEHPVWLYYKRGIPIVISTDDPGVSRNNLSDEYTKLVSRYNFSYAQIKSIVFNSIRYSFLSDSEKKQCLKKLESQFVLFEQSVAAQAYQLKK